MANGDAFNLRELTLVVKQSKKYSKEFKPEFSKREYVRKRENTTEKVFISEELKKQITDILVVPIENNFLYQIIYKIIKNRLSCDDLYYDFIEKVLSRINDGRFYYKEEFSLKTYLGTMATNFAIDHYRRIKRDANSLTDYSREMVTESGSDDSYEGKQRFVVGNKHLISEEFDIEKEEPIDKVFRCLELIRGHEEYFYLEQRILGAKYQEISNKFGIPLGTIKGKLHRGMKLIESRMSELEIKEHKNE
jgi:RNA polymerase sigma factor (sigma-70 family)